MRIKRRVIGLEDRIERLEEQARQATCLHKLEDRVFGFDSHGNYVEKCYICKKVIQQFNNAMDWNKARIRYMKARIEEIKKSIARVQEEKV